MSVSSYETDLKINKIANATDVAVNGLVNFTISVKNHGTANATGVHIIDELDSAFEFVDASAGYKLSGKTVTWNRLLLGMFPELLVKTHAMYGLLSVH